MSENSARVISRNCIVKLQAVYDSLKTAEKKAADLLLDSPEFFAKASIVDAAETAKCSEATLVRLARRLGYSGYPELKSHLLEKRDENSTQLYVDISEADDYSTVVSKVFKASIQALTDTLDVLNKDEYEKAVKAIGNAGRILFCGIGDAAAVARSGYQKFLRIGLNVQVSSDTDLQLITASHLEKDDVLIAISHSGRTKSIIDVVKYTKTTGASIICITNYPVSPLTKNSDIVLLTASFDEHVRGEVMSKRITELCILESLFINVLLKYKSDLAYKLDRSNVAVEINKL